MKTFVVASAAIVFAALVWQIGCYLFGDKVKKFVGIW